MYFSYKANNLYPIIYYNNIPKNINNNIKQLKIYLDKSLSFKYYIKKKIIKA